MSVLPKIGRARDESEREAEVKVRAAYLGSERPASRSFPRFPFEVLRLKMASRSPQPAATKASQLNVLPGPRIHLQIIDLLKDRGNLLLVLSEACTMQRRAVRGSARWLLEEEGYPLSAVALL